jgi:uncharacterized protein YhaN
MSATRTGGLRRLVVIVVLLGLAVTGCGESKADKATKQVCSARADISKQVDTLKALTLSTATTEKIRQSLSDIRDSVASIADAQKDLSGQRKDQITAANQQFSSEVKSIVSSLGTSLSASDARQQLRTALDQLSSTYEKTLAPIDCASS